MTGDVFKKAVQKASALSPEEQDEIGSLILLELEDEAKWTKAFESSQDQVSKMAREALKEFHAGKTEPMTIDGPDSKDLAS